MLEIKFVSQNLSTVQKALAARGHQADLDTFKKCDDERRTMLQEIESLRHQRNVVSDRIAAMKKAGDDAEPFVLEMRAVSLKIKDLDKKLSENQESLNRSDSNFGNWPVLVMLCRLTINGGSTST